MALTIPKTYRAGIEEGRVCRLAFGKASRLVVVRGVESCEAHKKCRDEVACVHMDAVTPDHLGVKLHQECNFQLKPVHLCGELRWALSATEIGYRISALIAVFGLFVGVPSFILAVATMTGCGMTGKNTKSAQDSMTEKEAVLSAKLRCAQEGRRYEEQEKKDSAPRVTQFKAYFAYNPKLNTCLYESGYFTYSPHYYESRYIVDLLTNETLAESQIQSSAAPQKRTPDEVSHLAEFKKKEEELFGHSNLDF